MKVRHGAGRKNTQNDNSYRYESVASSDYGPADEVERGQSSRDNTSSTVKLLEDHLRTFKRSNQTKFFTLFGLAVAIILILYWAIDFDSRVSAKPCDTWADGFVCSPEIARYWGQYSPYFSVPSDIPPAVPDRCTITFAQVLSRHGARDPTFGKTIKYKQTINKIHDSVKTYSESFKFIQAYNYDLGADQLSMFGEQQMVHSGHKFYDRYRDLARNITPFIRASDQNRVVQSAFNWTQGFHKAWKDEHKDKKDSYPYEIVEISEAWGQNNTLDHGLCTVFEISHTGEEAQKNWVDTFMPPILQRLNDNLPSANLSSEDAIYIMDLCPYETVHSPVGKLSPFCSLFTEKEWHEYDYYQSLGKYYGYGWGEALGATQGVGFANELIARLTSRPVDDHTSTNHTLDNSSNTFPLGAILYADFSHDNDMTSIFSALGLYNETQPLLKQAMQNAEEMKGYSASWTVPFGARAYFEKMSCAGEEEEHVRVVVNDRVLPLHSCGGDRLGRCKLSAFVESLSFARAGGNWDKCFV